MDPMGDEGIQFTVKELLADIRGVLDRVEVKLDAKADRQAVDLLSARLDRVQEVQTIMGAEQQQRVLRGEDLIAEFRITQRTVYDHTKQIEALVQLGSYKKWLVTFAVSFAGLAVAGFGAVLAALT